MLLMINRYKLIVFIGGNDNIDQARLERESTQLSEDFERDTKIPRNSNFTREQEIGILSDEDEMNNNPDLDQAATRIQASYRGYKARKELGSISGQNPPSISPQIHNQYDNGRNKNSMSFFF
jgi:hypothetical protein